MIWQKKEQSYPNLNSDKIATGAPYGIDVLENANAFCLKQVSKPKITNYILLYLLSQVSSILVDNEKSNSRLTVTFFIGDPYENRTRVTAVKGRCLDRLTKEPNLVAAVGLEPTTCRV